MYALSPHIKRLAVRRGGSSRQVAVSGGLTVISLRMSVSKIADSRLKEFAQGKMISQISLR